MRGAKAGEICVYLTHSSTLAWRILGGRRLIGYSPWGRKESDMTKQLHLTSLMIFVHHFGISITKSNNKKAEYFFLFLKKKLYN